ncbi:MAG: hypothetical protein JRF30_07410, partial [Deltaproteobacteria bacterium]|nr:hypothetical protein [Deltaproteobacteria bacterium]
LRILALGVLFRTGYKISDSLARALGAVYRRAWRQAIYASMVVFGTILGAKWGLTGVGVAVVLSVFINYLLMSYLRGVSVLTLIPLNLLRSFEVPACYILAGSLAGGFAGIVLSFLVLPKSCLGSGIEWVLSNIDIKGFGSFGCLLRPIYERFSVASTKVKN